MAILEIPYIKSPQWRAVAATGVAMNAIGGPVGLEFMMRFTFEWVDVKKEIVEVQTTTSPTGERYTVSAVPKIEQTPLTKIEEVAVRMPTEGLVRFIVAALTQVSQIIPPNELNDQQKKSIVDAFAKFQSS